MESESDQAPTWDRLDDGQRAVAWAVIRSVATACWIGLTVGVVSWVLLMSQEVWFPRWLLFPTAGFLGLTLTLEVKSRDLEKPARR
jgi:hypothetical protein